MGVLWLVGLPLLLAQGPYQNPQQGGFLSPQQFVSPQFISSGPQMWASPERPRPNIFDLDLKSLGMGMPSSSRTLSPLTSIDTASNAIFPLTDITAEPTQTAKNSEQTISIYQDTLTKMYREVTAQKDSIKKSDDLIQKLLQVQANNKKILEKNMATVKKYSAGLVTIVTQYTESLDMAGPAPATAAAPTAAVAKAKAPSKPADDDKKDQDDKDQKDSDATKSFMEKLAQLKKHAVIGLNI